MVVSFGGAQVSTLGTGPRQESAPDVAKHGAFPTYGVFQISETRKFPGEDFMAIGFPLVAFSNNAYVLILGYLVGSCPFCPPSSRDKFLYLFLTIPPLIGWQFLKLVLLILCLTRPNGFTNKAREVAGISSSFQRSIMWHQRLVAAAPSLAHAIS